MNFFKKFFRRAEECTPSHPCVECQYQEREIARGANFEPEGYLENKGHEAMLEAQTGVDDDS